MDGYKEHNITNGDTFIQILEDIHDKVEKLRLSGIDKDKGSFTFKEASELFNYRERGLEFYFFVYLWYVGILNDDIPSDEMDVTILLNISDDVKKKKILEVWESINSKLHHTFPEWMQIIGNYHLNRYRSDRNDLELVKWINGKYLYFLNDGGFPTTRLLLGIIEQTELVIGIAKHKKRMLVLGDEEKLYFDLFTGKIDCDLCTLYPQKEYYYNCSLLNSLLLGDHKIQVLKRDSGNETVFPFNDAKFDTIYSFIYKEKEKNTQYLEGALKYLDIDGVGYMFYQPFNIRIDNKWNMNYDYPLIASSIDGTLYLCKNTNLQDKIRSLFIWSSRTELEVGGADVIVEHFVNLIKKGGLSDDYQELTKEDFLYAPANTPLNKIFRQADQIDFVFATNVFKMKDHNYNVPAKEIPDYSIIDNSSLSNNPFNYIAPPNFYLEYDVIDESYSKRIIDESFSVTPDEEWGDILNPNFKDKKLESKAWDLALNVPDVKEKNLLECCVVDYPVILYNEHDQKLLKVEASKEHPVCYRQRVFFVEEYSLWCNARMIEIEISPEYDEDFILYQLCTSKTNRILVAPTKEEQKAYYLKKKEEYFLKNANLINEIRKEERKRISVDLHYLKHDAAQYLSKISSAKSLFEVRLNSGALTLTDEFKSGNTVKDYLEDIGKCVRHVTSFLEQMTFLTDVLPQKPVDISQLLLKLVENTLTTKKYEILLELSESLNGTKCLLDERIHKAFDNILSNAERHAFTNKNRKDYKISIKAVKEGDIVILTFSNNGTPPDRTLTEEGFFTRGLHVGPTGHSGFGGSIIRETIEAQNGIVHLHLNNNSEYPFQLEIKLPVYYD